LAAICASPRRESNQLCVVETPADLARLGYRAKHSGDKLARFLEAAVAQLHFPPLAARNL